MTFNDIFKSNFLEKVTSFSPLDMALALAFSFIIGLFIFYVYKKTYTGVMYSAGFGVSLIAMNMITTLIIMAVTSNVVLSLGMVGALSIVRFRAAVKEPLDIAYLFWSIASGIVLGAGMIPLAVLGSLVIGLVLILFVNRKSTDAPFILVVRGQSDSEKAVMDLLARGAKKTALKSKTVTGEGVELTLEVRLINNNTDFMGEVYQLDGITQATLVSYNGDYMS